MMNSKAFWLGNNAVILGLYAVAAVLYFQGQTSHWLVILAAVIVVAHVLEIPLAMKVLKDKSPSMGRLIVGTILFGFTWWLPAKKGIYKAA